MNKSHTILITGATGYLGSHLTKALVNLGFEVHILVRSTSNTHRIKDLLTKVTGHTIANDYLEKMFNSYRFDTIIHCATDYGRKSVDPLQIINANLVLPLQLLEYAIQFGTTKFINTDTILDKGINHYSLSKQQFMEWLHSFQNKLNCINVKLGHFYGPGDDTTKFVSFISKELLINSPHIDLTAGEQKRTFLYIDDVVKAFVAILQATHEATGFTSYEVSAEEQISIRDLVTTMKKIFENTSTELRFGVKPYRINELMEHRANLDSIKSLGWQQQLPLNEGLMKMYQEERQLYPIGIN